MFSSYDLVAFGKRVKYLRKSLSFTQKDIERIVGINPDTLRKIEAGLVVPRYDTLELLSVALAKDLLKEFITYRKSDLYFNYYQRLDTLILDNDLQKLRELQADFHEFSSSSDEKDLVNIYHGQQFNLVLKGISLFYDKCISQAIEVYIEALQISIAGFDLANHMNYKYSFFDTRILLLIATALSNIPNYDLSNDLLDQCIKYSNFDPQASFTEKCTIIKLYFNLSYNAYSQDKHELSIKYADEGIRYCNLYHISYLLAGLTFRKGVSMFYLKNKEYKTYLKSSIQILHLTNHPKLADQYEDIARKRYDFDLQINV